MAPNEFQDNTKRSHDSVVVREKEHTVEYSVDDSCLGEATMDFCVCWCKVGLSFFEGITVVVVFL